MKTAILTFQFAHNYGALLQAYALKQYLKSHDLEGEIAPSRLGTIRVCN